MVTKLAVWLIVNVVVMTNFQIARDPVTVSLLVTKSAVEIMTVEVHALLIVLLWGWYAMRRPAGVIRSVCRIAKIGNVVMMDAEVFVEHALE